MRNAIKQEILLDLCGRRRTNHSHSGDGSRKRPNREGYKRRECQNTIKERKKHQHQQSEYSFKAMEADSFFLDRMNSFNSDGSCSSRNSD